MLIYLISPLIILGISKPHDGVDGVIYQAFVKKCAAQCDQFLLTDIFKIIPCNFFL